MKLSHPITVLGKEVSEIEFKKPNGGTIRRCGYPFKIETTKSGSQIQHIDAEAVTAYVSELGNIPPSSVDALDPEDYMRATAEVLSFFGTEEAQATS